MSGSAANVVLQYAVDNDIFQSFGLDVRLTDTDSGSASVTALVANDFQICQVAGTPVVNGVAAGADLVIVGGLINQQIYSLVVRPEIEAPEDLMGKAVAASRAGGASDLSIRKILTSLDLQPDIDVTVLAVGGQSERLAAMEAGTVAGTIVSVPETAWARELGFGILVDSTEMKEPYQHTVLATSRAYLAENRPVVTNFMKGVITAIAQMKQDREGAIQSFARMQKMNPESNEAYFAEAYDVLVRQIIVDEPYPDVEGVQALIDSVALENPAGAALNADQLIDASILRSLEESGFFDDIASQ
ncbi:MAG: hypothetical protein Kow0031_21980 [Anaerolineae bacterium]